MKEARASEARCGPDVVWEQVACPLCHARNEELVLTDSTPGDSTVFRLVRCRSCGLGYLNPRPDPESIKRFYPTDYQDYQLTERLRNRGRERWRDRLDRRVLERRFGYPERTPATWWERVAVRLFGRWLGPGADSTTTLPWHGQGRLLDFGCGSGWFAERMRQRGWDVEGIDFSAFAARQAEQTFGFPVHVGTLPHPDLKANTFDLVNMGQVLEHVHQPHEVIEGAAQILRPGGLLSVSVPNVASWGVQCYGANSWLIDLPRHLLHFDTQTLRRLLQSHGLRVREVRMPRRVGWMKRTLRNVWRDETETWSRRCVARLASTGILCSLLTRWTVWRKQADCLLMLAQKQ